MEIAEQKDLLNKVLEIQKTLDALPTLYFLSLDDDQKEYYFGKNQKFEQIVLSASVNEFIKNCLDFYFKQNYTLAYKDNFNSERCDAGRNRSIGDIYRVVKHYYPKTSLLTVIKTLVAIDKQTLELIKLNKPNNKLIEQYKNSNFSYNEDYHNTQHFGNLFFFCNCVEKRVFTSNTASFLDTYNILRNADEFGLTEAELYELLNL